MRSVVEQLHSADHREITSSAIDTDSVRHRVAYEAWFKAADIDSELAAELYAVESDGTLNPFAVDVGPLLRMLQSVGVRVGVVSDIHFDLRPLFAGQLNPDGGSWADLIDVWTLSFELGVAKPDPTVFRAALDKMMLPAEQVLMVADRGGHDCAATDVGITTLLVPPPTTVDDLRLQGVADLVQPGTLLS